MLPRPQQAREDGTVRLGGGPEGLFYLPAAGAEHVLENLGTVGGVDRGQWLRLIQQGTVVVALDGSAQGLPSPAWTLPDMAPARAGSALRTASIAVSGSVPSRSARSSADT